MASARAGTVADYEVLGFSRDGDFFAFEEFGREAGTGYPFSNVFVIDTARDVYVRGSPFRTRVRNASGSVEAARKTTLGKANDHLARYRIGAAGEQIISDEAADVAAAARFFAFSVPDDGRLKGLGRVRLRLTEFPLPRDDCSSVAEPMRGFSLVLEDASGEPIALLEEDTAVPRSRGCPLHYGLTGVRVMMRRNQPPVIAVIISVYGLGFEGYDRKIMAVTAQLEDDAMPAQ